jgi:hypothetical protein
VIRVRMLVSSVLALCLVTVAACGGESGPSGGHHGPPAAKLVAHADPAGFTIAVPKGWKVGAKDGLLITARSGTGELVAAAPFVSPDDLDGAGCLERARATFASLLTGARLGVPRSAGESETVASVRYTSGATPSRGAMLCALHGRAGMLFAIGAPSTGYASSRAGLLAVLRTLRFTAPRGAGLSYETFTDPNEHAWSVDVPAGWQTTGGLIRSGATQTYNRLVSESPDGKVRLLLGVEDPHTYAVPNQATAFAGKGVGDTLTYADGTDYVLAPYASAPQILAQTKPDGCAGVRRTPGHDDPDAGAEVSQLSAQAGVALDYDVADVSYRCSNGRGGYGVLSVYRVTIPSGFTDWGIDHAYGYLATDDRRAEGQAAFARMISSFKVDAAWQARQNRTNAQVSQIAAKAEDDISRTIESTYQDKSASEDRVYAGWSDATLGQTEVRDPDTGDTYTVESGHNYYWRPLGSGTAAGSDTPPPPDVNLTALEALR